MLRLAFALFAFLLVATCAASPIDNRIVGGTDAAAGEFPYIVSLKKPSSHSCGGSIISDRYILTAAHCVAGSENNPGSIKIQYGVLNIKSKENIVSVEKVIRHENYTPGNGYPNDVALLKLVEPINFDSNAQPVVLADTDEYPGDNATAILVGWGRDGNSNLPEDLQKVEIVLFTDEFCESTESDYGRDFHVCAGVPPGGKGQCNGDSGGPLTVNGKQYGVVSWSVKPCSSKGHPGIFAKVTSYRDWIKQNSGV